MKVPVKLSKWFGSKDRPNDVISLDPAAEAELERVEKLYGIENPSCLKSAGLTKALMLHRTQPIYAQLTTLKRKYSMLHTDVLAVLYYLGKRAEGNALEIGPYLGGSTMATAIGLRASGRPRAFVTVEVGGEGKHPTLRSRDIVQDLKQNLVDNGLSDFVEVVVGPVLENETAARVFQCLPARSVGLLTIDADGEVQTVLDLYQELLRDICWVVIDDYYAIAMAKEKAARTKSQVDAAVAKGDLEELGFYGWGTWVGRWRRKIAA